MIEGKGCARSRLGYLHEFLFGAFGADDVLGVRDEAPSDEGGLARGADEAVVVPVSVLERDEPGAANTYAKKPFKLFYKHGVPRVLP